MRQEILRHVGTVAAPVASRPQKLTDFSQLGLAPVVPRPGNPLSDELAALLPARFLVVVPFAQLDHLPRYLKALLTRAERAKLNPTKDQERARQLVPYLEALRRLATAPPRSAETQRLAEEFRWLVEEFKVSLFAQELGTTVPVSTKRLDQQLERLR